MKNADKKKVLHFIITDVFSGAESVAAHIIKDLPDDWEGYYVAPKGVGTEIARNLGINVIECNTSSVFAVRRLVKKMKPDIVHAHDCRMSLICAFSGCDFVSHLHANWPWMKNTSLKSRLLKFSSDKAKKVICVSDSIKKEFVFSKKDPDKFVAIENTVDAERIHELSKKEIDEIYDLCFVGRLIEYKQPELFVKLVGSLKNSMPQIKAVMVGDGELRCETESLIMNLGLESNIKMVGFDTNPYKYVNKSKIGVITSSVEGFGLVAVEEMMLGLPVMAFSVGGLKDIITNDSGLLAESIDEMAEEALKLLSCEDYYKDKSKAALERSRVYSDRKAYINKIVEVYEHR